MDHGEAEQMMAVERYLLDELTPEERDAFERHLFDCHDCAIDLRAGSVFVTEARAQLSQMESATARPAPAPIAPEPPRFKKSIWSVLWRPAFTAPVFAALLAVVAYQNVSTIPALRKSATEPRILHSNAIHAGTRGSAQTTVLADRTGGLSLSIALPQSTAYSSYSFELRDPDGKQVWTQNFAASSASQDDDGVVSLVIPGAGLKQGVYSLSIFGITPASGRVEIDKHALDVRFDN